MINAERNPLPYLQFKISKLNHFVQYHFITAAVSHWLDLSNFVTDGSCTKTKVLKRREKKSVAVNRAVAEQIINITRIAKAESHKVLGKSSLYVSFVIPVRPVHNHLNYHDHHNHGEQEGDHEEVGGCT